MQCILNADIDIFSLDIRRAAVNVDGGVLQIFHQE